MEKRIELEKRGRRANQITDLNLDNCRSTNIVGLTDEFTALESLSLINVGLTTLKGFPKLPNLKKLELSDNRITNALHYLTTSPKLTHLNLSGNKIKDLESLKPLASFQNLEVLDLFNNESTSVENYREKIFAMIPSLKYLDGFDANEEEAPSEAEDDEEVNGNDSEDEVSDEIDDDDDDGDEEDGGEDGEDDDDSDEEDNGEVALAEVYNEDLEEDNSEWEEDNEVEGEGEGEDEDEEEESDEEGQEASKEKEAETPEESQARGKKRKHDG